jgi:hypothetical protein
MSTPVAVGTALGAAALFAGGTALQYRAAFGLAAGRDVHARSVARLARRLLTSRRWQLGTAVLFGGFVLHAVALHDGPLTLVQPLLITGVLFALPASSKVGGPAVSAGDMRWAVILVAALAVFLATATPASQPARDIDTGPAVVTLGLALGGISMCVLGSQRWRGTATATFLGLAAGIALAGSAALIKVCTDVATNGVEALLGSWQLYALLAVGVVGLLLSQLAYRSGPIVASLPAINTANPVVSVIIGTAVFDERFRVGTGAVPVECASLALALVSTVALSRRSAGLSPGWRA